MPTITLVVTIATVVVIACVAAFALREPAGAVALVGCALVWLRIDTPGAGPVLLRISSTHGVHLGDLPALGMLVLAVIAAVRMRRTSRP
jgi:hypothetical protein